MILDPIRLIIGVVFLIHASRLDLRTRKVPNPVWIKLGGIAILLLGIHLILEGEWYHFLVLLPIVPLFAYAFVEVGKRNDPGNGTITRHLWVALQLMGWVGFGLLVVLGGTGETTLTLLGMCVFIVLIYGMYYVRILHGGADAKAMMVLTLLVPFYPSFGMFPLWEPEVESVNLIFTFPVTVLTMSVFAFAFLPLGLAVYNLYRGDTGKAMFFGYRLPLEEIPNRHVWLMDRPVCRVDPGMKIMTMEGETAGAGVWLRERGYTGERRVVLFPKRLTADEMAADLSILKHEGVERAWVTPKMPFMVAILFGYVVSFLFGNLLLALMDVLVG